MKKTIFILTSLAVVMVAAGVAFTQKSKDAASGAAVGSTAVSGNTPPAKQISRAVVVEKVSATRLKNITRYPGSVKACRETRLAFRVGGPLVQVNIKAGDQVKKGAVLMQIDPRDYKDGIGVLNAQLAGAQARLENARRDFARMKELFEEKVIPQADFDHARAAVHTADAGMKAVQAQLKIARHQLGYTTLKAPYDAIVTATHIENFEMVAPGREVVGLHDISHLEIKINVPENEIIHHPLVSGTQARVRFPSLGEREFTVTLKEWNTAADRATRTYGTTFTMPRPADVQLLPGMTAEIKWPGTASQGQVLTMPAKAVVKDTTGTSHVWLFDPATSTASRTPVRLGSLCGSSRIVVKSGLMSGDLIVTDGMDFITGKMKLSPTLADTGMPRTASQETL